MNKNFRSTFFFLLTLILGISLFLIACQKEPPPYSETLIRVSEEDFHEEKEVNTQIIEGLEMSLWAPGPLLSNAVALTVDHQGVVYVSETARRKSSDIDIRAHWDWMNEDLGLITIEDTEAFHKNKLATALSTQNTWQEDFNKDGIHDYKDLMVQTEYIRRIWDEDEDGKADASQLFADGFNSLITGVAAGILSFNGQIFLTAAPDLWRLKDKNKDGIADERESLSYGYGIHIGYAGHDMSGLTMGMDGKVYWSIGDLGVNVVDQTGKRWAYPNQGCVMRCNPDGSEFEVFAHGVRNPQELAFDNYGNLISVDNDGDHPGEHERYIHILEGSDTGWRINWQYGKYDLRNEGYKIWTDEQLHIPHFPGQAAYLLPPLALAYNGPAGLAFNPGTALSKEWNEYFFASFFTGSSSNAKIQAFQLKPKGASFKVDTIIDIVQGIVPTGICFGPEGSLYINDWKDSYNKKPEGRIWKLSAKQTSSIQKETQLLLKEGLKSKSIDELAQLISHSDQRVRLLAQFALVEQKQDATLQKLAQTGSNLFGRLHSIWGLGQLGRQDKRFIAGLVPLLEDPNEHIRAQVAKVMGEAKYSQAGSALLKQLNDPSAKAQYFAAEALGKINYSAAFQELVKGLEKIEESDPHLRHGFIYALANLKDTKALAALAKHPSKFVRIGAVVALRMLKAPEIQAFLNDEDVLVLAETARAIHDDFSIPEAMPALAKALEREDIQNEVFLRRAINANLRLGRAENAARLANYSKAAKAPLPMKKDALWALGYWTAPPELDRVDGRYRGLSGHKKEDGLKVMQSLFSRVDEKDLSVDIITAAGRLDYQDGAKDIYQLFRQPQNSLEIKQAALEALANLNVPQLQEAIKLALEDSNPNLRQQAQVLINKVALPAKAKVDLIKKIILENEIAEKQRALSNLSLIKEKEAAELLSKYFTDLKSKQLAPSLQLDVLMAIENSSFEDLKKEKLNFESSIDSLDKLAYYGASLYGGNLEKGKQIFERNTSAQCLRCHKLNGKGGEVGPALDAIASKLNREDLLLSLIAPDQRIAPGYGTVIITLQDNSEIAGLALEESNTKLRLKIGEETKVFDKADIKARENLPSGMFNMSDLLSKAQIRDLMAYLASLN